MKKSVFFSLLFSIWGGHQLISFRFPNIFRTGPEVSGEGRIIQSDIVFIPWHQGENGMKCRQPEQTTELPVLMTAGRSTAFIPFGLAGIPVRTEIIIFPVRIRTFRIEILVIIHLSKPFPDAIQVISEEQI